MAMMCDKILGMEDEITNVDFTCPVFWEAYENCLKNHIDTIDGKAKHNRDAFYKVDPDKYSKILYQKHEKAWGRKHLINLKLNSQNPYELQCNIGKENFHFGSDIIVTSFAGYDYEMKKNENKELKEIFKNILNDKGKKQYCKEMIDDTNQFYHNIGSFTIFPRNGSNSINPKRGTNQQICDRIDLTLECIRRYYNQEESPLYNVLVANKNFFDLFGNFKKYVDFFCFQDWVSDDYAHVKDLMRGGFLDDDGNISFEHPFPQSVTEYEQWMENQLKLVKARTQRINQAITEKN